MSGYTVTKRTNINDHILMQKSHSSLSGWCTKVVQNERSVVIVVIVTVLLQIVEISLFVFVF